MTIGSTSSDTPPTSSTPSTSSVASPGTSAVPSSASPDRVERFLADVAELQSSTGDRNTRLARVGAALMAAGVVVAVLALLLSQTSDNVYDQMTDLSLGIAGLTVALVGTGMFLYHSLAQFLRFWMLRLLLEGRRPFPPGSDDHREHESAGPPSS